jgi:hypothetical protein
MALLRTVFWFALFIAATFFFTVIFEHGPMNFREDAAKEYATLTKLFGADVKRQKDSSDKLSP